MTLGLARGIDRLTECDSYGAFWTPLRDCIYR